jgi:hypothetical protein
MAKRFAAAAVHAQMSAEDLEEWDGRSTLMGGDNKRQAASTIPLQLASLARSVCGGCLQLLPLRVCDERMTCAVCEVEYDSCPNWLNQCGFTLDGQRVCRWCAADERVPALDHQSVRFMNAVSLVAEYRGAAEEYARWFRSQYRVSLETFQAWLLQRPKGLLLEQACDDHRIDMGNRTFSTQHWLRCFAVDYLRRQASSSQRVLCAAAAISRASADVTPIDCD